MRPFPLAATGLVLTVQFLAAGCGRRSPVVPPTVSYPPAGSPSSTPTVPAPKPGEKSPRPSTPMQTEEILPADVVDARQAGPSIRIGITTTAREAHVSATGEFYVIEKSPEAPGRALKGVYHLRVEREVQDISEVYRLQVASLSNAEAAEELRRRISEKFSLAAVTRKNLSSGTTQVRLGEFSTQEEALKFAQAELARNGYADFLVVRETTAGGGGETTLALRGPGNFFRVSSAGFMFLPSSKADLLRLDGKPYRGIFDLSLNKNGRITAVNQLGIEDYLPGVVPAEISPTTYPEFSALAAQAIAARTYALKNVGRFTAEGFDLTADVRTQVYGGVALEKQATNEAVRRTHGLAIYFQGEPINAMYSSTCGGKTEDFSNVFDGTPVPYLTSVFCTVESGTSTGTEMDLRGRNRLEDTLFADDGSLANRDVELAAALGIITDTMLSSGQLGAQPSEGEIREWVSRARALAGIQANDDSLPSTGAASRAGYIRYAAENFFGSQEIRQRISSSDADYYMSNLKDGDLVPRSAAPAFAFLMQKGLWRPYPDNSSRPLDPIRRIDALPLLIRSLESVHPDILKTGSFGTAGPGVADQDSDGARILVKWGSRTQLYPVVERVRLFRRADGRSTPAESIRLIGNEKISYHVRPDGKIDFLEVELNPTGASSDRFSPQATWETTLTRQTVSEKLRPLASNIGELKNLTPERLGNSGRVVQIRASGALGSQVLNGYRVRNALGLKDTLFTISRTRNPEGEIESFTFNGRGWGHGVGLCQVGAFGMARAGLGFEEILKTYYRGVEIRKAY